jgi:hypothetical protein
LVSLARYAGFLALTEAHGQIQPVAVNKDSIKQTGDAL